MYLEQNEKENAMCDENYIEVTNVIENEDGSADYELSMDMQTYELLDKKAGENNMTIGEMITEMLSEMVSKELAKGLDDGEE